jgi:hypothetical protein
LAPLFFRLMRDDDAGLLELALTLVESFAAVGVDLAASSLAASAPSLRPSLFCSPSSILRLRAFLGPRLILALGE